MTPPRLLVIMGSGETSPTMVKTHREIFARLCDLDGPDVLLDTPYGFQENADDISAKAVDYFRRSVGQPVDVASFRRAEGLDPVQREAALARLSRARWVFAGPGSPTYTLRQWAGTEIPDLLADKLARGGAVTFASAAALTLGLVTVPVYEIYKVGAEPAWADGLDLLSPFGLPVAVIPHYDNAEGGNHDTRFCYLGERRLRALEASLPDQAFVLGVDEHTGCILDLDAGTATVVGIGQVTLRRQGRSCPLATGTTVSLDALAARASGAGEPGGEGGARTGDAEGAQGKGPAHGAGDPRGEHGGASSGPSLWETVRQLEAAFDAALARRDVAGAVRAVLDLDQALAAWSADTLQSDEQDRGRAALRRMVVRLGELAALGARPVREVIGPYVSGLLAARDAARRGHRYDEADEIRDRLTSLGVEVRDTAGKTEWDPPPVPRAAPPAP